MNVHVNLVHLQAQRNGDQVNSVLIKEPGAYAVLSQRVEGSKHFGTPHFSNEIKSLARDERGRSLCSTNCVQH